MAAASITITYQDFKDRAISWWLLLVMVGAGFTLSALSVGPKETMMAWSVNVLFLVFQFALVALAFGLGRKQWHFFDHLIGWGDVLFLVAIAALFSTVNFLVFYCVSLVLTLVGFGIYKAVSKQIEATVPLAGALSIGLMLFVPVVGFLGYAPWDALPIYEWMP